MIKFKKKPKKAENQEQKVEQTEQTEEEQIKHYSDEEMKELLHQIFQKKRGKK